MPDPKITRLPEAPRDEELSRCLWPDNGDITVDDGTGTDESEMSPEDFFYGDGDGENDGGEEEEPG